jgi:hypothetical protein
MNLQVIISHRSLDVLLTFLKDRTRGTNLINVREKWGKVEMLMSGTEINRFLEQSKRIFIGYNFFILYFTLYACYFDFLLIQNLKK